MGSGEGLAVALSAVSSRMASAVVAGRSVAFMAAAVEQTSDGGGHGGTVPYFFVAG